MKTHPTIAGNAYVVFSKTGCTVTDSTGTLNKEVPAGDWMTIPAPSDALITSDDNALVRKANFKLAALALGLLGGGSSEGGSGGNELPAGYTRVEFLESTGTQVIQSGILPSLNSIITIDCQFRKLNNTYVYGSRGTGVVWAISNHFYWNGDKGFEPVGFPTLLNRATIENKKDLNGLIFNGELFSVSVVSAYPPNGKYNDTLTLFSAAYLNNFCSARIFSFKLEDKGQKLLFVPCLDPTGAPCMYDLESRQPFYNSGSGDFLYPSESTTYALRRVLPDWGQLTPHGLRRLYRAPNGYQGDIVDYAMENGFKPIVEHEKPEEGYWAPVWHEREDCIELEWVESEPPAEYELLTEA